MIKFLKVASNADPIRHGSALAAGYDLPSLEYVRVAAGKTVLVRTGWSWRVGGGLEHEVYGQLAPRSGMDVKRYLSVRAGVIDADYEGEIMVALHNRGTADQIIERGDYVAQMVIKPFLNVRLLEEQAVEGVEQSYRVRGAGGFGSSDQ